MTALPLQQPLYGQQVKGNLTAQDLARLQLAQQLLKSGTDTSPIESPWQGVARLGQALAGAYGNYRVGKDVTEREGETASTMAQALRATKGSWTNPDTGQTMPIPNAQGGMEGAMSVLAGNPNTAGMAAQMGFAQLTEQQKLANALKEYRGKGEIDLEQKPKLRGLELAAEIQPKLDLRQGELNQNLTMNPQIAAATAKAENPFLINRATSIHAGNVATDVRAAPQLAYGRTLGEANAQLAPAPNGLPGGTVAGALAQTRAGGEAAGQGAAGLSPVPNPYGTGQVPQAQALSQAREVGTQGAQAGERAQKIEGDLRKEFEAQPLVKTYRETVPIYGAMVEAASRDNKAADLNMVYGLAKIMDPTSVVRESEFAQAAATGALGERVQGYVASIFGSGKLTPEIRAQILREAQGRMDTYRQGHDQIGEQYGRLATQAGARPENVVNVIEPSQGIPVPTAKPGSAQGALARGTVVDGYMFLGGDPNQESNWRRQ